MKRTHGAALLGLLVSAGCAGPFDQRWDGPGFRSDRARAERPSRSARSEAEPIGLDSLGSLGVEDAIRIAIASSPSLTRAGYLVDIETGRVTQAGLYPNPTFSFDAEALGSSGGNWGETTFMLGQEIVLGGRLARAQAVAELDRLAALTELESEEFAVAGRVARAFAAAVSAREKLASRGELIDLSVQLLDAATAQAEAGAGTEADRLRAEIVREQAEIEMETARLDAEAALRSLASEMGLMGTIAIPLVVSEGYLLSFASRESVEAEALGRNRRVVRARLGVERARRAHGLAKAEGAPELAASVGPRYSDHESETTIDVGVGIEIPIFDRNQGNIRAAQAARLASAAELGRVELEIRSEVSRAWASYESARLATERYRDQLLPKAERTLSLTRQAYELGKADYLRLLDAQQVVIETRIASLEANERLSESGATLNELAQSKSPWRDARESDARHEENQQ